MSTAAGATSKRSKVTTILLATAMVLIALLLLAMFTMMFGNVAGTEFAPHNFQTRNYHVLRVPLINLQVWPVQRVDDKSALVEHLFGKDKILTAAKKGETEFDLVEEIAGARVVKGDARFLQKYLTDTVSSEWLQWTRDHADLAKAFWPEVQRVANRRLYTAIPEMFHIARQHDTPDSLKTALNKHIASSYLILGQAEYEQGAVGPAIVLLEEAKTYAPTDQEIEKLLTEVKSKAERKPAKS
jgi:hypothetical protein